MATNGLSTVLLFGSKIAVKPGGYGEGYTGAWGQGSLILSPHIKSDA